MKTTQMSGGGSAAFFVLLMLFGALRALPALSSLAESVPSIVIDVAWLWLLLWMAIAGTFSALTIWYLGKG